MRSIFDILHKNFQEDQLNSRRFPGFPGVVDTLMYSTIISTAICEVTNDHMAVDKFAKDKVKNTFLERHTN